MCVVVIVVFSCSDGGDGGTTPTVDFSSATYSGNEDSGAITVTVNLSAAASDTITVAYATSDGTATAGTDYTAASGTLTFVAADTSETFTVTPTTDTDNEDNETVTLTLSSPSGATLGTTNNPATLTIIDDDSLTMSSTAFQDNGSIPDTFTCDGDDWNPELNWASAPSGTQSFVLIVDDVDAPGGEFIHWGVKNISSSATGVAQNAVPTGGWQFLNDFGATGWGGPCPPLADAAHSYEFTIYALNVSSLSSVTISEAVTEMSSSILEQDTITGEYDR